MTEGIIIKIIRDTIQITLLVFIMMTIVDIVNVWTRGKVSAYLKHGKKWRQYIISSAIGTTPGCVGGFTNVSLYIHGMISFGALVGSMISTSGDEAFVMIALFPKTALVLFGLLFIFGIIVGWLTDKIVKTTNIRICEDCKEIIFHDEEKGFKHYFEKHIWNHIIKQHLWKVALWTLGSLFIVEFSVKHWNLEALSSQYTIVILLLSILIGLIPESGPHLIFITLYANGIIPFSVLFTSCAVQDGHSMLPMLSYSIKDSIKIKAFNAGFGLIFGLTLYLLGL